MIAYYVSSQTHPVQLRVIGPTKLRISTRLNYDSTMKGEQKYSVSVWEAEKKLKLKPLSTTKSVGVHYKEMSNYIPGKVNAFFIDIPNGEHIYKFNVGETNSKSVSMKFSIPQKDLKNEE